jgi:hypothetical protein
MIKKKLGIGVQNIRDFSLENIIYVDKTEQIHELMQLGKHNFLARPRRFGKSLLLDTIAAMHEGSREQFKGTWAYEHLDWNTEKRPVLRIDFTLVNYETRPLAEGLMHYLRPMAQAVGIDIQDKEAQELFAALIETMGKKSSVVILIDEYEIAVTDFVGKDDARVEENLFTLKKFYGTMKGAGRYIHRSYITGVSKIGKVGILSDLNMLNDLSLDERFSTLLGYTEYELRHYYADYITEAAQRHGLTEPEILGHIKAHYNGYSWDGIETNRVYNPFSIVNFFQSFDIRNYWFATGTPTLLTRGARRQQITMEELEDLKISASLMESANLKSFYSVALLFQTGYLTIKSIEKQGVEKLYTLSFPNREVRESFASYLLAEYIGKDWDETELTLAFKLRQHLQNQELKSVFQIFASVIASTPYDITKYTEGYFHTIMHVLMYSTGLATFSEMQSSEGRLDTICEGHKAIYIFEFKLDSTASIALNQIKEKGYSAPFLQRAKALYITGVNFSSSEKRIDEVLVEAWDNGVFKPLHENFTPYIVP